MRFFNFFLHNMVQKYRNEIAPIFYYGISKKTNEKDLKIPYLQPPDWNDPYWMSLYVVDMYVKMEWILSILDLFVIVNHQLKYFLYVEWFWYIYWKSSRRKIENWSNSLHFWWCENGRSQWWFMELFQRRHFAPCLPQYIPHSFKPFAFHRILKNIRDIPIHAPTIIEKVYNHNFKLTRNPDYLGFTS